jgi:hypothetical protein
MYAPKIKEGPKEDGIKFVHGENQNEFRVARCTGQVKLGQ